MYEINATISNLRHWLFNRGLHVTWSYTSRVPFLMILTQVIQHSYHYQLGIICTCQTCYSADFSFCCWLSCTACWIDPCLGLRLNSIYRLYKSVDFKKCGPAPRRVFYRVNFLGYHVLLMRSNSYSLRSNNLLRDGISDTTGFCRPPNGLPEVDL